MFGLIPSTAEKIKIEGKQRKAAIVLDDGTEQTAVFKPYVITTGNSYLVAGGVYNSGSLYKQDKRIDLDSGEMISSNRIEKVTKTWDEDFELSCMKHTVKGLFSTETYYTEK